MTTVDEVQFAAGLLAKVNAAKKWKAEGIDKVIQSIMNDIHYFNSLPEDEIFINGRTINDIPIISELKDLVIPNSVRLVAGDRRYDDMLERPKVSDNYVFSYSNWMNNLTCFRGYFKKDLSSDMVWLSELKINKALTDVIDYVSVQTKAKYDGVPFIPLKLADKYETLIASRVHTTPVCDILEYYIAEMRF